MKRGYIYIMSNKNRTTLYIGVSSDLNRRMVEHSEGVGAKFTKRYNLIDLLYYEEFDDIGEAIAREKQLKNWKRDWKMNLIKSLNPELKDLKMDFR